MSSAPPILPPLEAEWLAADGLGGFASGTVSGIRTRRYHALLLAATQPPAGRMVLVNGLEVWLETAQGRYALSSQLYAPNVTYPDGASHLVAFSPFPWPQWTYRLPDGSEVVQELIVPHGHAATSLRWTLRSATSTAKKLLVRPLLSGRDFHGTHHENSTFRFDFWVADGMHHWQPYPDVPGISVSSNGRYNHQPCWYRNFLYKQEEQRGLDCEEDLAAPGEFQFELSEGPAELGFAMAGHENAIASGFASIEKVESARLANKPLHLQAADSYIVKRGAGHTIMAGYPWFGDWGRDTFISLRGLCLSTGQFDVARDILVEWSSAVSEGMLPNRFPDKGDEPEYNSVDASLWYIVAVHDYLSSGHTDVTVRPRLIRAVQAILEGYSMGTRYGIRMDSDGLITCGAEGVQLTWMDAKVGNWVVTPRRGKPVEIQALWINALMIAAEFDSKWQSIAAKAKDSFESKFWNEAGGVLYDVIDIDGKLGTMDLTLRPNQIFALGGLPNALLQGERAARVLASVEQHLLTPLGLRSLAPGSPDYAPHYEGNQLRRDGAYHQGTVWPWLIGPFVEAWLRVYGTDEARRQEARSRFLSPLYEHMQTAGLGHISEIADAESPFIPRGCPFQAWSLGELLRIEKLLDSPL